jgi:hypothetical protein
MEKSPPEIEPDHPRFEITTMVKDAPNKLAWKAVQPRRYCKRLFAMARSLQRQQKWAPWKCTIFDPNFNCFRTNDFKHASETSEVL